MRKCLMWFQFSWIFWGLFCVLCCGLSLKMFHMYWKRMCILLLWDENFYIYLLRPFDLGHWSMPQSIHFWQWGVKIPLYKCVVIYIFLKSSKILLMYLGTPMFSAHMFTMVMSSWWNFPLSIMSVIQCLFLKKKIFYCYSITVVCLFTPSLHTTPAEPTSLPHLQCLFLWLLFWSLFCLI